MLQHLSERGSLPDPSVDTHSHYQSRPILVHELEEATYDSHDLNLGSIVEWASVLPQGVEYKAANGAAGGNSRDISP